MPILVERQRLCLADLPPEQIRELIGALHERSNEIGCVVFEGDGHSNDVVAIFAGNAERFHMLAVARHLRCRVVYVQDPVSGWYGGSPLLPNLETFCDQFLVGEIGSGPALLFGQSSGAYAALVASGYCPGCTVVACAPQTFADAAVKAAIHFAGIRVLSAPDDVTDIRAHLQSRPDASASRTVVIAAGEGGNPATAHFWMDYLHALHLRDLDGVQLSVVQADNHAIVHGRVNRFAELLRQLVPMLRGSREERYRTIRDFLEAEYGGRLQ